MKRYKEGKGKHGGTTMLSGEFVRNVDLWRKWAAVPMTSVKFDDFKDPTTGEHYWTLDDDGKRICQWREADAPGLSAWVFSLYVRYHGAWHVARDSLTLVAAQKRTAAELAAKRKAEAAKADAKLLKAARAILKGEPRIKVAALAAVLSDRGLGGKKAIEKKLPRLLGTKESTEGH